MRLATILHQDRETACICLPGGVLPLNSLNTGDPDRPDHLLPLLQSGRFDQLLNWYQNGGGRRIESQSTDLLAWDRLTWAPLYRSPPKIWGIGLNYREHAADLDETSPTGIPGSFMKPATTIIGHMDTIRIPRLSHKTTAEGELGIIIGRECRNVDPAQWRDVVAGFTTIIDMTAEDILRLNPRYLTISKSFDTFFSFGPVLVTPDEIDDVRALQVATVHNGTIAAENVVANMTFDPQFLVSFLSQVTTLLPGDIISTGTPGAVRIAEGDTVECRITGFSTLINTVVDTKTA